MAVLKANRTPTPNGFRMSTWVSRAWEEESSNSLQDQTLHSLLANVFVRADAQGVQLEALELELQPEGGCFTFYAETDSARKPPRRR
jgi:hypothetical protein